MVYADAEAALTMAKNDYLSLIAMISKGVNTIISIEDKCEDLEETRDSFIGQTSYDTNAPMYSTYRLRCVFSTRQTASDTRVPTDWFRIRVIQNLQ